jgi:hypothetical protein
MEELTITKLLERYETSLNAACVLKCLTESGVLRDIHYDSTSGSGATKCFKEIAPEHIKFGVNLPTLHEFKTEPKFYAEHFVELLNIVVEQLRKEVVSLK